MRIDHITCVSSSRPTATPFHVSLSASATYIDFSSPCRGRESFSFYNDYADEKLANVAPAKGELHQPRPPPPFSLSSVSMPLVAGAAILILTPSDDSVSGGSPIINVRGKCPTIETQTKEMKLNV